MPVAFDVNVPVLKKEDVTALGAREVESRLKDAAQKAHELWVEYDRTDGKLSADEAKAIRTLNDNMTVLKERHEELTELAGMRAKQDAEYQRQTQPLQRPGMFQPGPQAQGKQGQSAPSFKSLGEMFVESDAFKGYTPMLRRGPVAVIDGGHLLSAAGQRSAELKAVSNLASYPIQETDIGRTVLSAQRRPVVADLIPQATTNSGSLRYVEETTFTNAAAAVAESGTKPESGLSYTEKTAVARKIATWIPVTDELMADSPAISGLLDARLRLMIQLEEERELISGSGAPELTGILNASGIQTQAKGTDPAPDAIYKAIVLIQTNAFMDASGVLYNPLDWQDVRLLRTADGVYIWGNPSEAGPERIWGLPVVRTVAMPQNTAIVAAFDAAMQIFRRTGIEVAVSSEHSDFFTKNQLAVRAEERLILTIFRPSAICSVTGV